MRISDWSSDVCSSDLLFPQKIVILSLLLLQEGRCRRRSALQRGSDTYAPGPCGKIGAFAARRSSLGSNAADLRQFLRPRRALQHPVAATKIGHGMFRLRQLPMYPINLGAQGLDQDRKSKRLNSSH